jgi:GlpG protein
MADPTAPQTLPFIEVMKQSPVTAALIIASVVVAVVSALGSDLEVVTWLTLADLRGFDRSIGSGLEALQRGEVWRLVTPILIHFSFIHILFNMLWMKDLGPLIERRWSSGTLLWLVLVSAVLSNLAQFLVNWDLQTGVRYANALSGGMSGVVYALLGYLWMRGHNDPAAGIRLPSTVVWMMLGWLVLCMTGALGPIGNSAHAVGLLVGALWGRIAAWASVRKAMPGVDHWA